MGGIEDAGGGLLAAHAFVRLRREDDGGAVGAHHLDHAGDAFAVGDGGELVDDQQHLPPVLLARGKVLLELLDEEATELAGLFAVEQLVEEQVAKVGVLEGPVAVELSFAGVEEGGVALPGRVEVLGLEGGDGGGPVAARPQVEQGVLVEPSEQLVRGARRPAGAGACRPDEVDGEVAVVGSAAFVGPVDQLHESVGDLLPGAAPAARLREEMLAGKPVRVAVAEAVRHVAPAVAAAGLVLASSFGTLMLESSAVARQQGFAMAFGILLASLIVSFILVPAVTALAGQRAWSPHRSTRRSVAKTPVKEVVPQATS